MGHKSVKIFLLSVGLLCLFVSAPQAQTNNDVKVQLVIIIDGSGSISNADFRTMINGIANAISDPAVVPHNGTIEFGLVQFSGNLTDPTTRIPGAQIEVPMTVVTAQNIGSIAERVRATVKGGGFTPMVSGIRVAAAIATGNKARPGARQVFNVVSDGQPNLPPPPSEAKKQTLEARDEAVRAGLDQLDAEGIGDVESDPEFKDFLLQLAWPQPGVIAPPFPPGHSNGFVIIVKTFADLENALKQKLVATINEPPVADPGPIPDGKPDTEPYKCNTGQTINLDGSGSFDPNGQITKYEWDFNGDGRPDASGAKVNFTCPATPGSVTIKLTVTDDAGTTATAQQTITVSQAPPPPPPNQPPTANCGTVPSEVLVGQTVQLDGSGSSDPEGKALTYQWAFVSKPADSQAVIENPTNTITTFKADREGSYTVRLTVTDSEGASASCTVSLEARKITGGGDDDLGNMKRDIIEHGRTLSLAKPLENLRLAISLLESFGAVDRARQLISETQQIVNELLVFSADTRFLMESITARAEGVRLRIDALVEGNTISSERANRIHKSIDELIEFSEGSSDRLDEIEAMIEEALDLLAEAEDSLSNFTSLAVDPIAAMSPAELIRSARDKLLLAFAQWRALLNGAIARIDKVSSQIRAALKLADRRKRFRLVKSESIEPFIELRAAEHSVRFVPSAMRWSVQHCEGCSLKVVVYALDGRRLVEQESLGPTLALRWPHTPANGLYWYLLTVENPDGRRTQTLGKLVLLR